MNMSEEHTSCLNSQYSTTRLLINEMPSNFQVLSRHPQRIGEGGLRTKGYYKKSYTGKPLISVITVVFNGGKYLEQTIQSVLNQTYDNVEYIIIDGGSTDGTLNIIREYDHALDYWVSEPDKGIYDAMNKGLFLAAGDWVNFMNCGDSFYGNKIIDTIFKCKHSNGVIYGDVIFSFDGKNDVHVKARSLKYFWKGMPFVHQATFVCTSLMRDFPFDTKYRLIADYNSLYRIFLNAIDFQYVNFPICKFLAGGLSDNNPKTIVECQKMIFNIHKNLHVRVYYYFRYIDCTIKYNFAKFIGQSNYAYIRRIKRKMLNIFIR